MKIQIFSAIFVLFFGISCANAQDCSQLTRKQCLHSSACILELIPKNERKSQDPVSYRCVKSSNLCEQGFVQASVTRQSDCEKKKTCHYQEANCYCSCKGNGQTLAGDLDAPPCDCECGGGPPASCEPVKKNNQISADLSSDKKNIKVSIDGKTNWPPQGKNCSSFVQCCTKASQSNSEVDLFCKMESVQKDFSCDKGLQEVAQYLKEKGKAALIECRLVK